MKSLAVLLLLPLASALDLPKWMTGIAAVPGSADPDFNDPRWPDMWYLNRSLNQSLIGDGDISRLDMNVLGAWGQGFTGQGTRVVIIGQGVDQTHPDLADNFDAGASIDLIDGDDDPYANETEFGYSTGAAGIIAAAANNSECIVGVAYNSKFGVARLYDGTVGENDTLEAEAFSFSLDVTDVYFVGYSGSNDGAGVTHPGPETAAALKNVVKLGRGGKGAIVVLPSGWGGADDDDCNRNGLVTSPYTVTVSAATSRGRKPDVVESCSSVMAAAFSAADHEFDADEVVTTGVGGECETSYGVSSSAAAVAAGIVALALEANPQLGWRDLQHLVVRTARPILNDDWSENAAGLKFSRDFGFGLMDAGAMTAAARDWRPVAEQKSCWISSTREYLNDVVFPGKESGFPLDVEGECGAKVTRLEQVFLLVSLDEAATTARRGDVSVSLTSPSGTRSVLLTKRPNDRARIGGSSSFTPWPLKSLHFWGEELVVGGNNGVWTLSVMNNNGREENNAVLKGFTLGFSGTGEEERQVLSSRRRRDNHNVQDYEEEEEEEEEEEGVTLEAQTSFVACQYLIPVGAGTVLMLLAVLLASLANKIEKSRKTFPRPVVPTNAKA